MGPHVNLQKSIPLMDTNHNEETHGEEEFYVFQELEKLQHLRVDLTENVNKKL